MKRIVICAVLMAILAISSYAQAIDKTVATIKLTKTEAITQKQFQKLIQDYEKRLGKTLTIDERKSILDLLVSEKLILQAAIRDGVTVTDAETNKQLQQAKSIFELQLGKKITDDQFKSLIEANQTQMGYTWDKLMEEVKNSVIANKYVQQKYGSQLKDVKKPSDEEIAAYFDENRTAFVSPEMMKVKQIVVITQGLPTDITDKYKKKIDEIYDKIANKGANFDEFFEVYVEGQKEKIGGLDIGVWQRDDEKKKALYGKDFVTNLFKMKAGSLSPVLKSNIGYHIIQIVEKVPFQTLELNDKIPPNNTETVKDKISAALQQNTMLEVTQKLQDDLVTELKKTAVIKITDANLTW